MDKANIAAQMRAEYDRLGSWQAVADKIKTARKPGGYSRGAVAFWASGQRRIPDDVAAAWKGPRQRRPRACIEVSPETAARLRERKRAGETWDETLARLLEAVL